MKTIFVVIFLFAVGFIYVSTASSGNTTKQYYSQGGWQPEDCEPSQPWANMGIRCTTTPEGACTARNTKCKPYSMTPGGPISDLNQFGLDYDQIRSFLINTWGWSGQEADSLIIYLRGGAN